MPLLFLPLSVRTVFTLELGPTLHDKFTAWTANNVSFTLQIFETEAYVLLRLIVSQFNV